MSEARRYKRTPAEKIRPGVYQKSLVYPDFFDKLDEALFRLCFSVKTLTVIGIFVLSN